MENCSGLQGQLREVDWYVLPDARTIPDSGGAVAMYHQLGHRVVLAKGQERHGLAVRHEMLHALGADGHPRALFRERCGGIVDCGWECTDDDVPHWDTGAPRVSPSELSITVDVLPAVVHLASETRGCVTVVVGVQNPLPHAVTLDVQRGAGISWLVEGVFGSSGGPPTLDDRVIALESGGSWTYAFDCPDPVEGLAPGTYPVRGRVMGVESDAVSLTVVP